MRKTTWLGLGVFLIVGLVGLASQLSTVFAQAQRRNPVLDDEPAEASDPGLLATYRSLHADFPSATLTRIEAKPAFTLGQSSPHPRLPSGPFEVTFTGTLDQTSTDAVRFGAFLGGTLSVVVNNVPVLESRGDTETTWVQAKETHQLPPGRYPLRLVYRSLPGVPARLQLLWEGTNFSWEPLPAWRLNHPTDKLPSALRSDELAAQGRLLAGQMGCARCHQTALPAVDDPPPGPSLTDLGRRVSRDWLLAWLADPAQVRDSARMPALFTSDRTGFVERWLLVEHLLKGAALAREPEPVRAGKPLAGRTAFLSLGCIACHPNPEPLHPEKVQPGQYALEGLAERMPLTELAAFIENPHIRYPDKRMPRVPVQPQAARDIAAFLHSCSTPTKRPTSPNDPPTSQEIDAVVQRLGVAGREALGPTLLKAKQCLQCHTGLEESAPAALPIQTAKMEEHGCLSGRTGPRFKLTPPVRQALTAYLAVAAQERHASPFEARQQQLRRTGCLQCHQRDRELLSPLEEVGSRITDKDLSQVAGQRTPRLTNVLAKYQRSYVLTAIRDGVQGVRAARFTYRMPAFGADAEPILQALAEGDGDLITAPEPIPSRVADPELPAQGPTLVGSAGYTCISCHLWKGKNLSAPEAGAAGPELTSVTGRIRRDYFDRWLDNPSRVQPRTPMPQIFHKGQPALLATVLNGDPQRQKDALWSYFALGAKASEPLSLPPTPVPTPAAGAAPLVAQIPLHLPDKSIVESLCVLFSSNDVLVYDIGRGAVSHLFTGARLLRVPRDRRSFALQGTPVAPGFRTDPHLQLSSPAGSESPSAITFLGYDRLSDGVRIRTRAQFGKGPVEIAETLRLAPDGSRRLLREVRLANLPTGSTLEVRSRASNATGVRLDATAGHAEVRASGDVAVARFAPNNGSALAAGILSYPLPPAQLPPPPERTVPAAQGPTVVKGTIAGDTEQPGYRALAYPRFKTLFGEDLIMPGTLAVNPRDGRLYLASMKMGELFRLHDPNDDGTHARFENFGGGLFQDAYSMVHDGDALYLLHRRNLTRIRDVDGDGVADTFDRLAALQHSVKENTDNAYGLVRDPAGRFVFTYAANTSQKLAGWGSILRLTPGEPEKREEIGFGLRRSYGWCTGPDNEIFLTDNQGEWVATNRIGHVQEGRTFGYPNPGQEHHKQKPMAKTAVWVPYGWALSTNGLVYDTTGGKFGPFAGQFFTAGWTDRGGIIRAQVEKVNGVYQGACFPFWGKGMLGPLVLAFDPKGRLFVGSITEGSCGAHPDRGALFRIDFTGQTPFEMQSIHVRPRGFRVVFTTPVEPRTAGDPASYVLEHYRYLYTGEYGSPELDRTRVPIISIRLSDDGRTVDLETSALVKDRVYMIHTEGVRSAKQEPVVHPVAAYTLHEIPTP